MTREDSAREYMRKHFGKRLTAFGETNAIAAMIQFADAEAAAMRERAAGVCEEYAVEREGSWKGEAADDLATAIRNLPTTGEE